MLSFVLVAFAKIDSQAQCTYLAYDGFDYSANAPLNGLSGGTGWQGQWEVQNTNTSIPGIQSSASTSSLTYSDLQTIGIHGSGGYQWHGTGRRLNTISSGPFAPFVAENSDYIGSEYGDTLWVSFVMRKLTNTDSELFVDLHPENLAWCNNCSSQHIAVGYFGSNSNVAGQRRWSMRLGNNYFVSDSILDINENTFFAIRIIFNEGNTNVALFINPPLGYDGPGTPALQQNTNMSSTMRSVAFYLGDTHSQGALDELRLATSFTCVAPDADVPVNLPPVAVINASSNTGQIPLNVIFNGSSSYDPENTTLTYLWNFGDGSPTVTGANVSHTFDVLGIIPVSLTVSDAPGLTHTTYQNITLLDQNNHFPCHSSVTNLQLATCDQNNGRLRINAQNTIFSLRNQANSLMPIVNGNEYQNLTPGIYKYIANGISNMCYDSMMLHVVVDSSTCAGWEPSACAMDIGTNMNGFADWAFDRPMKNLMKHIRNEVLTYTQNCYCWNLNVADQMTFDAQGYPTFIPQNTTVGPTLARYVISSEGGNLRQDSAYVLLYDGVGTITIEGGVNVTSNSPGRLAFTALNNGNININITYSQAGNYVKNIRLLRPQDEFVNLNIDPFYIVFKDKISPFKVLRFMDWANTNGNTNIHWADRSKSDFVTYAGDKGVPYEVMIKLANELDKDVWICVPHLATDNYIQQMAQLFLDSLDSHLNIYLEYSNEVWNFIFPQFHYSNNNRPANLNYGRAMAERAKHIFEIWHNVFGEKACRVKRILGLQAGNNWLNEQILSQIPQDGWDFGSPTHYFGLDHESSGNPRLDLLGSSATVQDVMTNALNAWNGFRPSVKQDYRNVKVYGKKIVTYEGGQHFVGNVFGIPYAYQQAMWNAQNSDEMYNLYDRMHDSIRVWGCQLATNFSLASIQESVYGSWGVLRDIETPPPYHISAKKYQAVLDNAPSSICENNIVWNGSASSLWSNPCNWDKTRIPQPQDQVLISAPTMHPVHADINSTVKSILLATNATLQIYTGVTILIKNE